MVVSKLNINQHQNQFQQWFKYDPESEFVIIIITVGDRLAGYLYGLGCFAINSDYNFKSYKCLKTVDKSGDYTFYVKNSN